MYKLLRKIKKRCHQSIRLFFITTIVVVFAGSVIAGNQDSQGQALNHKISLTVENKSVEHILEVIESQTDIVFIYSKSKINLNDKLSIRIDQRSLKEVLDKILPGNVTYGVSKNKIILKRGSKDARWWEDDNPPGVIQGKIIDAKGNALPNAYTIVKGTSQGAIAGPDGKFVLKLPEGSYTLVVQYIGYKATEVTTDVSVGNTTALDIVLKEDVSELNELVVYGELTRGQAKALNTQKQANNIKNVVDNEQFLRYPDVSAAETIQRLPGISITRDQGEGEFVQIRGVPEQFNALTINGQRMPSMEPDAGRAVGLDLVQSYLIQTITVTKALTPDMDADALGGMVDFQLREATEDTELELYAGYGLNQQETELETFGRNIMSFSGVAGKRFFDNKLGALVSGSYFNTDRGSLFNSWRFIDIPDNTLARRRTTDYDVNRERYGFVGNFDFTPNSKHKWTFTANYNRYIDDEIRRQARYTFDNNREERRTRNRIEDQEMNFYQFTGAHSLGRIEIDYNASYSIGKEDLPDRTEFRFRRTVDELGTLNRTEQEALSADTKFGVDEPMSFNRVEFEPRFTEESNTTGGLDVRFPITSDDHSFLKAGLKYRKLEREFREGGFEPEPKDGVEIPGVVDGSFGYPDLRFTDAAFQNLGFDLSPSDINYRTDLSGYDASEEVLAGYLMNTTDWSEKLTSVVGVRVEQTSTDYRSTETNMRGEGSYTTVLPSAHITYRVDDNNLIRAAYSTGLSRPNYTSLIPFESIGDDEINRGNEDLEALSADNFDLMFESYGNRMGYFGFGVFAKLIDNQIITEQVATEDGLPVFTPVNGASASVFGMEMSLNKHLSSLNTPLLKWVSINTNYTFTESSSDYGDGRDDFPLAHSPKHTGNLSFLYDNPNIGLTAVIGGVYRHFMFDKLENADAGDANEDIWLDKTFHLDFSLSYALSEKFRLKLQVNNLTNESNTEINGKPSKQFSRTHETESYGAWGILGLEFKL